MDSNDVVLFMKGTEDHAAVRVLVPRCRAC